MRNISLMILTIFVMLGIGCTNPTPNPVVTVVCSAEQAVESTISAAIATGLTCTNLPAIMGDVTTVVNLAKICPLAAPASASAQEKEKGTAPKPKGAIANLVCPTAVDSVMGLAVNALPTTWNCTGGGGVGALKEIVTKACLLIPL